MKFGPVPPKKLPKQDPERVLLMAERYQRAAFAHERWATPAKEQVDFFEGRQWTEVQLAKLKEQGRPSFTFNIIAPIVRLVMGYQRNNKTDITFKPHHDGMSSEVTADALTAIEKAVAEMSHQEFVDTEVFCDGLIAGRGWFETTLDFEHNDLGECRTKGKDPFMVFPDPDADTYDVNESAAFMQESKFISIDEIEATLGRQVAELIKPWTMGQTPLSPITSLIVNDEVSPVRFFGQRDDAVNDYWDQFYGLMGDFVDKHRKTIRILQTQHKLREPRNVIIDLETGDKKTLPESWDRERIEKLLLWSEMQGNPCRVQRRMVERIQWTTTVADLILFDAPSIYDGYTMTGYFPYFRRGVARGMVADLVDPQKEKNKSRNARIEIESKTANGGWMYSDDALNPVEEEKLHKWGSTPGVNVKYRKEAKDPPKRIDPSPPAMSYERLEQQSDMDVRRISGINEAALGEEDNSAISGRAILARQRQAVISVQLYMDNFKRSKQLVGERHLSIFQNHYTEQRIYRVTGEDGNLDQVVVNELLIDPNSNAKRILNDITVGKYAVAIDDAPLSATFAAAQFDEMMALLEKLAPVLGNALPAFADLIFALSSLPRKDEWIERLQQLGIGAAPALPAPGAPVLPPPAGGGQQQPDPLGGANAPPGNNVVPMPARG